MSDHRAYKAYNTHDTCVDDYISATDDKWNLGENYKKYPVFSDRYVSAFTGYSHGIWTPFYKYYFISFHAVNNSNPAVFPRVGSMPFCKFVIMILSVKHFTHIHLNKIHTALNMMPS